MSSNLAVEESMAADPAKNPGGGELTRDSSAVESTEKVEIRVSTETIVEEKTTVVVTETKVEVSGSELGSEEKSTRDLQGNDLLETKDVESSVVGDVEEGNDPTEISLHDLTGGLDIDGKPTDVDMEEVVMEASVEDEADLVPGSTKIAEETKISDEQIEGPESGPTETILDQQKLEGSTVQEADLVAGIQKEKTPEEAGEYASEKELGEEPEKERSSVDGDKTEEFSDKAEIVGQPEEVARDMSNKLIVDEGLTVAENEEVKKATSDSCIEPMDVAPQTDVGIEHGAVEILEQVAGEEQPDNSVLHAHIAMDIDGADNKTSQVGGRSTGKEEKPGCSLEQNNCAQGITHADGKEAVVYHRREKHLMSRNSALSPEPQMEETTPVETHITYNLPSVEDGFEISDLVWGKVKSHPWWPGVIINPSDGSNLAMKFKKKDALLVAYFGDKTFAWCDESQLKPFFPNFSHFEKQASSDAFSNAVRSALVEVSRRFDVGMICSCLDEERFTKEVYPKLENAGVRQEFVNCTVDGRKMVKYFNPKELVDFIKELALGPTKATTDKLELVMTTSHVKAYYRMKGYSVCPKFQTFGPLEEYIEPVIVSSKDEELPEMSIMQVETSPNVTPPVTPGANHNPVGLGVVERPRKKRGRPPKKKKEELDIEVQKPLSALVRKKVHSNLSNGSQSNSKPERTTTDEEDSVSPLPWKKRKEVAGFDLAEHENQVQRPGSGGFGISFKIGECISRAASRLTGAGSGSSPLISTPKFDSADFDVSSDDETPTPFTHEEKRVRKRRLKKYQYSDPKEVLSQLCLVATGPRKEYSILSTVVSYFTDFRNFTVEPPPSSTETCYLPEKVKSRRGRKRKVDLPLTPFDEVVTQTDHMQDSYWSDMILCGQTEEPSSGLKQRKRRVSIETKHLKLTPGGPDAKRALAVAAAATKRPIIRVEEKRFAECNPTALLMSFGTRYGTVPSEMDIVRIFSQYGPLKKREMGKVEGCSIRVWIVFKRRADAEMAFSNLRKQNVFGPSLLSYRLVYEMHEKSEQDKKIEAPNEEEHFEQKAPDETVNLPTVTQSDNATVDLLRDVTGIDVHEMLVGPLSNVECSDVIRGDNVDEIVVDPSSNVESVDANVLSLVNPSNNNDIVDDHMDEIPVGLSGKVDDGYVDEMSIDPSNTVQDEAVTEMLPEPLNIMVEIPVDTCSRQIEAVDENLADSSSVTRFEAACEATFEPSVIADVVGVSIITSGTVLDEAGGQPSINAASTVHVAAVNEVLTDEFGTAKDGSVVVEPTADAVTVAKLVAPSCEVQGITAAPVSVIRSNTVQDSEIVDELSTVPSQNCGETDQPSVLHSEVIGDTSIVPASAEECKVFVEAPVDRITSEEGMDVGVMAVETNSTEQSEVVGEEGGGVVGKILAEPSNTEQGKAADDVSVEPASSEQGVGLGEMLVEPSSTGEGEAVCKMSVELPSTGQDEVADEVLVEASSVKQVEVSVELPVDPSSTAERDVFGEIPVKPSSTEQGEMVGEESFQPFSTEQGKAVGEGTVELAVDPSSTAECDVFGEIPVNPSGTEHIEEGKVPCESAETIQANERPVKPLSTEEGEVVGKESFEPSSSEQGKVVDDILAETIQGDERPVKPLSPEEGEMVGEESFQPSSTEQGKAVGECTVELAVDPSSTAECDVFGEIPVKPSGTEQIEEGKVQFESAETMQADERPVEPLSTEEGEVVGKDSIELSSTEQGMVVDDILVEAIQADEKPVEPLSPEEGEVVGEESFEPSSTEQEKAVGEVSVELSGIEQGEVITEMSVEEDGQLAEESVERPACTAEHFT